MSFISSNPIKQKPFLFTKLKRSHFCLIFKHLTVEDLANLNKTCKRLNNAVQHYMRELQVLVHLEDAIHDLNHLEFKHVILRNFSPAAFFHPFPPFKHLKSLYLSFDNGDEVISDKINLTSLTSLKYLKIRGHVQLSSNRLVNVTHLDIGDCVGIEKQIVPKLKNFHLELDVAEFASLHNCTESEAIRYNTVAISDILIDKVSCNHIALSISIDNMELLIFESLVDHTSDFLKLFDDEKINVNMLFKHSNYDFDENPRRWMKAMNHLKLTLPEMYQTFNLKIEKLESAYDIPTI